MRKAGLKAIPCVAALLFVAPIALTQTSVSPAQARAIARDAYVYGYPMVDNYRVQYGYFVNTQDPEYKGGWNQVHNVPRVYTPDDKAIQFHAFFDKTSVCTMCPLV